MKKHPLLSAALFLTIVALLIFRSLLAGGTLFTTDDNLGHLAARAAGLPAAFTGGWFDGSLVGYPETLNVNWTNLWLWLLPLRGFANGIHALDLTLASLLWVGFLRLRRCSLVAGLLGALTAFWVGSNFTLTYAGHLGKFGVLLFAAAALFCIEKTAQTRRISWALLAGGALGAMFTEQQDCALFMALMLGPYLLFALRREDKKSFLQSWLKLAAPVFAIALLVAAHSLLSGWRSNVQGVASQSAENPQAQWEFATQWSWPPEESVDFIAPGYTGWRSGEPAGPYWGRMGRSAGWEQTGQGFMNFKLENTYLGVLPLLLALFALFSGLRRSGPLRADTLFFGGAALLTLLLAFGKYFPLYSAFYHLPVIHNIRNPNKFLQVFQLAVAVLTAFGAEELFGGKAVDRKKKFMWIATALAGGLLFGALSASTNLAEVSSEFMQKGWPAHMAKVIASNQAKALWHAALLAGATAALLAAVPILGKKRASRWTVGLAAATLLLVVGDALLLSRRYVQPLPESLIAENGVTQLLKQQLGVERVALVTQDGFYNNWLTYLFPYHNLRAFNITQMPRMPEDYSRFLGTVGRNPLRMWRLSGVSHLMAPAQIVQQLPPGEYEVVFAYDVREAADGGTLVSPSMNGQHVILRDRHPIPRFALMTDWKKASDQAALAELTQPKVPTSGTVLLAPETEISPATGSSSAGTVDLLGYKAGRVRLRTHSEAPALLRIADKFDPGWRATVDGKSASVLRADYLFQALLVPAGTHEVELKFTAPTGSLWLQLAGMAVCAAAAIRLLISKRKPA